MSENSNLAVILAAGMGSRLEELKLNKPKGLITLGELPIIHESINKLLKENIKEIIVITGYKAELYEKYFKSKLPDVKIIKNLDFHQTNTLYSLSKARNSIRSSFLLLESDLIYEARAIRHLQKTIQKNVILLSNISGSGDEVFVESSNSYLLNMSKNRSNIHTNITGEFVGINKVSFELFQSMMDFFDKSVDRKSLTYEEDAFVECSKKTNIFCSKIDNLIWSEIDTKEHLHKAKSLYKEIKKTSLK